LRKNKSKLLVITPVRHIRGVINLLAENCEITFLEDPNTEEVQKNIENYDVIFTNPNKSRVYIGAELLEKAKRLKVVCTASTGTNHIDKNFLKEKGIKLISLTEEREVINRISSTAELAFALTLMSVRKTPQAQNSVLNGKWDYTKYIGRQMDCLTIGVIGYGRLGSMYAKYCAAFNARVIVYDPFKSTGGIFEEAKSISDLVKDSNIISLHVHVAPETVNMINGNIIKHLKSNVIFVNTSRGDLINEIDFVNFLKNNPEAVLATDVLSDEVRNRNQSPLLKFAQTSEQVIITPHIGGMTIDAQEIAYQHAAKMLNAFLKSI